MNNSDRFESNTVAESRRSLITTIPQSLWLLGLGVLFLVLLRVFAPALLWLLFPERIQDQTALHEFIGTLAQVLADVLGFTISVVAIVVQLSASRFTPKVTELFLKEKVNFFIILFLITADLVSIWTSLVFSFNEKPITLIVINLALGSFSFILLIPYFIFVFNFLQPNSIIHRIEQQVRQLITRGTKANIQTTIAHQQCLSILDEFKNIAAISIQQRESSILIETLDSLKNIALFYGNYKSNLVDDWFLLTPAIYRDPDFVSLEEVTLKEIEAQKIWLEVKIFQQYQAIFNNSLNDFRESCYIIAINTREIAEHALQSQNLVLVNLAIKFFNTYLRAVITTPDVRTAYTIIKEYRLLGEAALQQHHEAITLDIAHYFRYYCFLASKAELVFLPETFASDLSVLAQKCCKQDSAIGEDILNVLLKIDQDAEGEHQENTLRGIRKSQVKLAAYYLKAGYEHLAQIVFKDMQDELVSRLQIIFEELQLARADFWEFRDRGGKDFYYVEPELKPFLTKFLSWFEQPYS